MTLVKSIIFYGIEIWKCTFDIQLKNLKITLIKLIRFILILSNSINTDFIYNELKLYSIDRLFKKINLFLLMIYKHK